MNGLWILDLSRNLLWWWINKKSDSNNTKWYLFELNFCLFIVNEKRCFINSFRFSLCVRYHYYHQSVFCLPQCANKTFTSDDKYWMRINEIKLISKCHWYHESWILVFFADWTILGIESCNTLIYTAVPFSKLQHDK